MKHNDRLCYLLSDRQRGGALLPSLENLTSSQLFSERITAICCKLAYNSSGGREASEEMSGGLEQKEAALADGR